MYKNGAIRNLAMEMPERPSPALAPEKDTSEETPGPIPLAERIEKRVPMAANSCPEATCRRVLPPRTLRKAAASSV
jgi:hypothetical protein